MAISPDKNAKGELTGRYRIEVQLKGQRLRDRKDTIHEARICEATFVAQLRGALPMPVREPRIRRDARVKGSISNLRSAVDAANGRLWKGTSSEVDYHTKLRRMILILGDVELDDIGHPEFDKVIRVLEHGGAANATINRYLSVYNTFLKWCLDREYRTKAIPRIMWQKEGEGRRRWITEEEEEQIEDYCHDGIVLKLIRSAIKTGMRRSELLHLTPAQVEWHEADDCGWVRLWKTKNGSPRSVPIDREVYEYLYFLSGGNGDGGYRGSRMPSENQLTREWNKVRDKMGLTDDPWFVFHSCRHTCATRLVMANVNLAVIKEYMGHKTIETTLMYAHVNDTGLTDALRILNRHRAKVAPLGIPSEPAQPPVPHSSNRGVYPLFTK